MLVSYLDKPLIIIGMHRSGTTLLSHLFDAAGIFQGEIKDPHNEAMHFLSINQQTLEKAGFSWLHPGVPDEKYWFEITRPQLYAEHFKLPSSNPKRIRLLHNKKWGWKDPRNTFTLNMHLKMFPKARVIHLIRDGRDVALSLCNRNKIEGEVQAEELNNLKFNFKLWENYVAQGSSYKNEVSKFLEIKYEDVLAQKEEVFSQIKSWGGIDIRPFTEMIQPSTKVKEYPTDLNELAAKSSIYQKWYNNPETESK